MQRLIYSPSVAAWVKGDDGVYDLSPFIVSGDVNRKIGQVSTATLTIRNPQFVWTQGSKGGPLLHPMDPIVIVMTRLKGFPIQVFTGYIDSSPYVQLFPGLCTVAASCTLKRLQYTYWDPGLPFVQSFLKTFGWSANAALGGLVNLDAQSPLLKDSKKLTDGGVGELLFAVLQDVGGWDQSTIHIEALPDTLIPLISKIFDRYKPDTDAEMKNFEDFLHQLIGTSQLGTGTGTSSGATTGGASTGANPKNIAQIVPIVVQYANKFGIPAVMVLATMAAETGFSDTTSSSNAAHAGWFQMQNKETGGSPPYSCGPCSTRVPTKAEAENLEFSLGCFCPAAVCHKPSNPNDESTWRSWAETTQGASGQYVSWDSNMADAKRYFQQYGQGSPSKGSRSNAPTPTH